ncbi:MAG: hypothetical protein LBV80_01190 [Deltaproteobacteria bacterium]|jgi:hypothetical protein|nr:hypothetical protein [Deltaproteobacteria bacterium]
MLELPVPYFRRQQEFRGEIPTTFSYVLTEKVKHQIIMILDSYSHGFDYSQSIVERLRLEIGKPELASGWTDGSYITRKYYPELELKRFFLKVQDDEYALTVLEYILCSHAMYNDDIIEEINNRLQYERIGFKFVRISDDSGHLIKIEDEIFLNECIHKTLGILSDLKYTDALNHYMSAYDNLKANKFEEALVSVGKAIESLLKTRFANTKIPFDATKDTLAKLLDILQRHLVSASHNFQYFKQIILDAGRARNIGGHGHADGDTPPLNEVYVRFVINQAAANLLFLAEVELN